MLKIIATLSCFALLLGVSSINFSSAEQVPSWVKNTAKWYGEGKISESEFLNAIRFLVNNGIIILDESSKPATPSSNASDQELIEKGVEQLTATNNLAALDFFNKLPGRGA